MLSDVSGAEVVGKPFAPGELAAKARAALSRSAGATSRPH